LQGVSARVARHRDAIQPGSYLLRLLAVALVYWGAARLSLNLALVHGQVTPIWPPTGIAVVTILMLGRRMWPAIAVGAFAVNLPLGPSPLGAAFIACGNTLAPLASAELLQRAGFRRQLDRMRDAIAIVVLGALIGMTISATIGTLVLTLSGTVPMVSFASTWAVWWAGDAMGVLLVGPMLLSLIPRPGLRNLGWRRSAELTILLTGVGGVTYVLFENQFRIEYLVLPLIAIAAWRFRLAGAAPAALIASVIASWAAVNSAGPFASETLLEKMVTLQAFNVSVSLASLLLASFADARQRSEELSRLYQSASLAIAAKTDAIDVAAHELGPPVAVLTSYLAILSEGKLGPPPPKWRAILNVMADKAWQVNRIMNELVEAAQIEATEQPADRAYLDLREAIEKSIVRARPRIELSGAQVATTLGPEPVPVEADARQIGRILDNLINNSLTYVARPPRLKLDAVANGKRAVVHVIDNGIGMSDSERARVFEPFQRTKDPAFTSIPGAGLGLYTSRKLAEVNRGTLTLERTEPGVGTSFALDLPLARSKPPPAPEPRPTSPTS
jgi:signal transduction histidine kinase